MKPLALLWFLVVALAACLVVVPRPRVRLQAPVAWSADCQLPAYLRAAARSGFQQWNAEYRRRHGQDLVVEVPGCDPMDLVQAPGVDRVWVVGRDAYLLEDPQAFASTRTYGTGAGHVAVITFWRPAFEDNLALFGGWAHRWAASHEVGHALGLAHVDDHRCLMFSRLVPPPPDGLCAAEAQDFARAYP